jgi:toxin ParE1/3/4
MGDFRLTSHAESDLAEIADYTIKTFGIEQSRRYRDALETCFQTVADNPMFRKARRSARTTSCELR